MIPKETKELAENHWEFMEKWLHMAFVDGFIHGAKHEQEDKEIKNDTKRSQQ